MSQTRYDTSKWDTVPRISKGNVKLKGIPNLNLSPFMVCKDMPCFSQGCYSVKAYCQYPNVEASWDFNTVLYKSNPDKFFTDLISILQRKKKTVDFFRWHSAGEIIDAKYFEGMKMVARVFPQTRFLCFTKKYYLSKQMSDCPSNLSIIFSTWKDMKLPPRIRKNFQVAWVDDGSKSEKKRIEKNKKNAFKCGGSCENCRACWFANLIKTDIIFDKH